MKAGGTMVVAGPTADSPPRAAWAGKRNPQSSMTAGLRSVNPPPASSLRLGPAKPSPSPFPVIHVRTHHFLMEVKHFGSSSAGLATPVTALAIFDLNFSSEWQGPRTGSHVEKLAACPSWTEFWNSPTKMNRVSFLPTGWRNTAIRAVNSFACNARWRT